MTDSARWIIRCGTGSDVGQHRTRNEDSFFACVSTREIPSWFDGALAVADGMGGHDAGDIASQFVVQSIETALSPDGPLRGSSSGEEAVLVERMAQLLRDTNVALHQVGVDRGVQRGMGSTATLSVVQGGILHLAHVGDSRLYRVRDGQLEQMTLDHSWAAEQRRQGLITAEEEAVHPRRNMLTECIGIDREINVYTEEIPLQPGDRFLLCSDGLHGPVDDPTLFRVLEATKDPDAAAQELIRLANDAGGPDNITALVFDAEPSEQLAAQLPTLVPETDPAEETQPDAMLVDTDEFLVEGVPKPLAEEEISPERADRMAELAGVRDEPKAAPIGRRAILIIGLSVVVISIALWVFLR